jgi:hypothetical protein
MSKIFFKFSKKSIIYFFCICIYFGFAFLQLSKFSGTAFVDGVSYFVSPDEILYLYPGEERILRLYAIFSGNISDFNLNLYALLINYLSLSPFLLMCLCFLYYLVFIRLILNSKMDFYVKLFLIFNPVLPYLATSILRDLLVYIFLYMSLNFIHQNKIFFASLSTFFLVLLRPLTSILVYIYYLSRQKGLFLLFHLIIAIALFSLVFYLVLDYGGSLDMLNTIKRTLQLFGLDIFIKMEFDSFSKVIDVVSSLYVLIFALNYLFLKFYEAQLPKISFYIIAGVVFYCYIYASYLGFFVARTLYPMYIFIFFAHLIKTNASK